MVRPSQERLPARARQIMDILYRVGTASAAEIRESLPDELSDSAVRTMLSRLEEKGVVRRRKQDGRWVYAPVTPSSQASKTALRRLLDTFFDGSPVRTVSAILDQKATQLSNDDLDELTDLIAEVKRRKRRKS